MGQAPPANPSKPQAPLAAGQPPEIVRDYLVYFISDLPKQQNTQLMLALGPRVKDFLVSEE